MAQRRRVQFLRGPVPLPWLITAASLPGKAIVVALALVYKAGVQREATVGAGPALFRKFKVSRQAAYGGLRALEGATLVRVERRAGCCARVTLLGFDRLRSEAKLAPSTEAAHD